MYIILHIFGDLIVLYLFLLLILFIRVIFWVFDRDLSPIMPTMYPVSSPIAAPMEATKVRMIRFVFAWHAAISISG